MNYVDQLLNGQKVEWKTLGEVVLRTSNIKWNNTNKSYKYIDLTSVCRETNTILDTTEINKENAPSRAQKIVLKNDVIFATTRPTQMRVSLIDEKYSEQIVSTGYCVLRARNEMVLPKWIYFNLTKRDFMLYLEENQSGSAYPAISDTRLKDYKIPIPPLSVQEEIVRILDHFTALTARQKQYEYYRDNLLTPVMVNGKWLMNNQEVEWKTLGEVGELTYGYSAKAQKTGDVRFIRISDINNNGKLIPINAMYINASKDNNKYILKKYDILVARTGATYGKTMIFEEDYPSVFAGFLIKINFPKKNIIPKYYWHFSQSQQYWQQANKLVSGGGQPQFNANALNQIKIPIPPLSEQERIVGILDKFDTLTTSLSEGLPKEIELRQQQYEYYRDQLLKFNA